jgi:uncharacterized caspase-like protein
MKFRRYLKFRGFFLLATLLLVCQPAWAMKRVALVVGNSNYKNAGQLPNPANDAAALAATLKGAGFDVVDSRLDLGAADMRRALRDFADQARDSDVAVIYYAGHGIEIDGTNYLIPTDATLERDTDIYDEAFSLDRVLLAIEPARLLRLVIVDACRNNPFAETMKRTVSSRTVSRGLARVEPTTSNTLVAFAAKAGLTALDGNSKNSPYAEALVKYIAKPGLDLRRAFGFIRDEVLQATGNRQEPYVYGSLGGEDVALVPAKPVVSTSAADAQSEIRRDYELALQLGNKDALNAFLVQYPDGFYASLAKLQLTKIAAEEARVAATEQARLAEQERARLATEGAQRTDQEKAAVEARQTEALRVAAERAKQAAQEQAAEAERKRATIETPEVDKTSESKVAVNNATPDQATAGPSTAAKTQGEQATNLASLNPGPTQADLAKSVQTELRRVGCLNAAADGEWNAASQRSLALFNRYARTKFDVKLASVDTLDAIKLKSSRVCPLICEHGFKADGDRCSKIVCSEGSFLNDDNECEKQRARTPAAKRGDDRPDRAAQDRPKPEAGSAKPQASGQIVCGLTGCRPVTRGCHIEFRTTAQGGPYEGGGGNVEVCR